MPKSGGNRDEIKLREQGAETAQGGGELIGVVGRRIFELLEQGVDDGADFRFVARLGIFGIGDVERIDSHGGLFGGAFVGESKGLGIVGDTLERAKGHGPIVGRRSETLGETLRDRSGR